MIYSGEIRAIINTTSGAQSISDSFTIRRGSLERNIPCLTEIHTAQAFTKVLTRKSKSEKNIRVAPLK
jgi:carbamoyl-phosphate synthase large subunit